MVRLTFGPCMTRTRQGPLVYLTSSLTADAALATFRRKNSHYWEINMRMQGRESVLQR